MHLKYFSLYSVNVQYEVFAILTLCDRFNQAPGALLGWEPVIDGVTLLAHPRELAKAGQLNPVPLLLGTNADEGTVLSQCPAHTR